MSEQTRGKISGIDTDDSSWRVEVEMDCFDEEQGRVVSLYVETVADGLRPLSERRDSALAPLMPVQARELATLLQQVADQVERRRNEAER